MKCQNYPVLHCRRALLVCIGQIIKDTTPAGGGYAGIFSLQAGTFMTVTIMFAVAIAAAIYNITATDYNENVTQCITHYIILYAYVIMIMVGTVLVSTSALRWNSKGIRNGGILITTASAIWVLISFLSLIPPIGVYRYVCISDRCPPTHWLIEVPWRDLHTGQSNVTNTTETAPMARTTKMINETQENRTSWFLHAMSHVIRGRSINMSTDNRALFTLQDRTMKNMSKYINQFITTSNSSPNYFNQRNLLERTVSFEGAKVRSFLTDDQFLLTEHNRMANIAMSTISFVLFSLFSMYGQCALYYLYKDALDNEKKARGTMKRVSKCSVEH